MTASFAVGWRLAAGFMLLAASGMIASTYSVIVAGVAMIGLFGLTGNYKGLFWTCCGLGLATTAWVPFLRLHPRTTAGA